MSFYEEVKREIEALRKLEDKAFGPRHGKYDFYEYLEGVWKLFLKWRGIRKSQARAKRLASLHGFKLRANTHPIRTIIDASSRQDVRVKSRWTRALQYAEKHKSQVEKVGLSEFLESNGGPAGCSSKGATHRTAKKRAVRSNWGRRSAA